MAYVNAIAERVNRILKQEFSLEQRYVEWHNETSSVGCDKNI
jgi:hypothetical protein